MQKLLGSINWVRPYLKITTEDLHVLYEALNGDPNPKSPRKFTPKMLEAIALVEKKLQEARVKQLNYEKKWEFLILPTPYTPTGCLWQEGVLEWIHLPHTQTRMVASYVYLCGQLIIKARNRSRELFGKEMHIIVIPYNKQQFSILQQTDDDWGIALINYAGEIKFHLPKHPLLKFTKEVQFIFPSKVSSKPLEGALTIIKTDNTPAYTSTAFKKFCDVWNIEHITGIPYNPQGQAIVERTHQNLKIQIQRQRKNHYFSPHQALNHALFTLIHLNTNDQNLTPMQRHWDGMPLQKHPRVYWRDLLTKS